MDWAISAGRATTTFPEGSAAGGAQPTKFTQPFNFQGHQSALPQLLIPSLLGFRKF